ncbi:MAG: ATP-binding protein [archaeon]
MEIKSALAYWNDWWLDKIDDTGIMREKYIARINEFMNTREIIIIEGVRRSGKTTIMYQAIRELLAKTSKMNVCYINLDDSRFGENLEKIYEAYLELANPEGNIYFFIDEIQNIAQWEKWIKSKYDKDRKIKFIISGSTSSLLSNEYGHLLSGRYFRIKVTPLSFAETLSFKNIGFMDKLEIIKNKTSIRRALTEYLEFGGFPEVVLEDRETVKKERLKTYFESILLKDVILKNNIRNAEKIEEIAYYLLSNVASEYNYTRLAKTLNVSVMTVENYFSFIKESFLIDSTYMFSYKIKDQLQYPRKIYCVDNGIRNAVSFRFMENLGQLFENTVFAELKRRGKEAYYWRDSGNREIDFVLKEGLKITRAIQVSYNVSDEMTRKREIRGLISGMDELALDEGTVITDDYEGEEEHSGKKIVFVPLWKWLLE